MAGERDYAAVVWPWDSDPNWAQPREGATSDPADGENWRLACTECELHFPKDIKMGVVGDHWNGHFPDGEARHDKVEMNLVWVGLGTPPPAGD